MEQVHILQLLCVFKHLKERIVKTGDCVIDVGTGSGVLSIAAAMLGAEKVKALDLDEVAVQSAKLNLKLNKVHTFVNVSQNNLLDGVRRRSWMLSLLIFLLK